MRKIIVLLTIICFLGFIFYPIHVKSIEENQLWINKDIVGIKYHFIGINNTQIIFANKNEKTKEFNLFAFNKSNGKMMWKVALENDSDLYDLKCDNNNVLVKILYRYKDVIDLEQDCDIAMFDATNGKLKWKKTYTARHSPTLSSIPSEVFLDNERTFFTHNDTLYFIVTNTGELLFEYSNKEYFISPICSFGKNILLLKNFGDALISVNEQGENWKLPLNDVYYVWSLCTGSINMCPDYDKKIYGKSLFKKTPYIPQGTILYVVAGRMPDDEFESPIIVKINLNTGKIIEEIDYGIDFTVSDIYIQDQYLISNHIYYAPMNLDKHRFVTLSHTGETLYQQDEKANLNYYIIDVVDNKILSCDLDNKALLTQKPNGTIDAVYKPEDTKFTNIINDGKIVYLFYEDKIVCVDLSSMFYNTYQAKLKVDNKVYVYQENEKIEMKSPVKLINNRVFCTLEPILKISNTFLTLMGDKTVLQTFNDTSLKRISFEANNCIVDVDGKQKQIDPYNKNVFPVATDSTQLFPLRFLAESLDCKVVWKADTKEIIVTYQP